MKKIILGLTFILHISFTYGQSDLPKWMQQSGWVSFSTVCEALNELNETNNNCSEGTMVTDAKTLFNSISWAGEVVEMYYNKNSTSFTNYKIIVTWYSPNSKYYCGQILKRKVSEIKDFTKRSISLKKCN